METAARSGRLLRRAAALFSSPFLRLRRFLSFVAVRELLLHLSLLLRGLRPVTVALPSGTSLHLGTPRRRRRPALVLIHGFGGNAKWQWERQFGPLSRTFDLYILDLVFFGSSRSKECYRTVGFQARCVGEAMQRLGVARYSVAGISYGGFVGYKMAAEMGEAVVERVVVMTAGEQGREIVGREERDVCEILLPRRPEDLKDPEVREFIERCLVGPEERPSAEELLSDSFFHGIDDGIMLP